LVFWGLMLGAVIRARGRSGWPAPVPKQKKKAGGRATAAPASRARRSLSLSSLTRPCPKTPNKQQHVWPGHLRLRHQEDPRHPLAPGQGRQAQEPPDQARPARRGRPADARLHAAADAQQHVQRVRGQEGGRHGQDRGGLGHAAAGQDQGERERNCFFCRWADGKRSDFFFVRASKRSPHGSSSSSLTTPSMAKHHHHQKNPSKSNRTPRPRSPRTGTSAPRSTTRRTRSPRAGTTCPRRFRTLRRRNQKTGRTRTTASGRPPPCPTRSTRASGSRSGELTIVIARFLRAQDRARRRARKKTPLTAPVNSQPPFKKTKTASPTPSTRASGRRPTSTTRTTSPMIPSTSTRT